MNIQFGTTHLTLTLPGNPRPRHTSQITIIPSVVAVTDFSTAADDNFGVAIGLIHTFSYTLII
jgi:hypothetical protein